MSWEAGIPSIGQAAQPVGGVLPARDRNSMPAVRPLPNLGDDAVMRSGVEHDDQAPRGGIGP
jgi:hypothetical protein